LVIFIVWFVYIVLLGLLQAGCRNRGCKLIFGFGVWLAAAMMVFGLGSILGTDPFKLIQLLISERNHAEHYTDAFRVRQSRQLVKTLEKQITQCDEAITTLIAQDTDLARKAERLKAIPGVGPVVATTMLAEMPELGKLTTQTAAALAGVAPYNRDSGGQTGSRHINGGRAAVRCALYMATLSAVRHDRILKAFYLRLRAAGKKPLVAMTACMRKLVILMNRLLKNYDFQLAN
jgi:transposase